ncbi:MAG TPA: pyridoxamine 5'-phosphate oxidase family protein [Alphaproteobacteria bacterium]|nr:pyridoxamine 5'-phosphate oxidase family protein [Alphaproteobacteria bacterium]
MTDHQSAAGHVWQMLGKHPICMLATLDGAAIRARPMAAHAAPDENAVYFLTDERRHKDEEIRINPNVCLAFVDGDDYVSLSGRAEVTNDRGKIRELWSMAAKAWWDSADDPNIRLLKVTPIEAEYWDGEGKVISTLKMAAASVSGSRPDMGENKKVRM